MVFSDEIFDGYDIRGIFGVQLDAEFSVLLGKALAEYLKSRNISNVVISSDGAINSILVFDNLLIGLAKSNLNILNADKTIPQTINYFLATNKDFFGIYISHGHSVDNQIIIRITKPDFIIFDHTDLDEIQKYLKAFISSDISLAKTEKPAKITKQNLLPLYEKYLKTRFPNFVGLRLVLGLGDKICQKIFPSVFTNLGIKVSLLDVSDKISPSDLSAQIKNIEPDLGIYINYGYDDFYVFGNDGSIYDNDKILMLFADSILSTANKGKIVFDVKSTELLAEFIKHRGGNSSRIKTGYPYFIKELKAGALLGGEFSGNFYFKDDYFGYDDHIYTILRILERIYETKRPLSYIMQTFPMRVHSSEIKLPCPDDLKHGLIDTLITNFRELPDVHEIDDTDGVRVKVTPTGWFLIRASITGPYLSLRVEGLYEKEAAMIVERVKMVLTPFVFVETENLNSVKLYVS